MTSVRTMLARVQRLEQARQAPVSPIVAAYGSIEAFAADADGLDAIDFAGVVAALQRWERDGVWHGHRRITGSGKQAAEIAAAPRHTCSGARAIRATRAEDKETVPRQSNGTSSGGTALLPALTLSAPSPQGGGVLLCAEGSSPG